ncbi:MAG TPA: TonB-dependent receptor [Steroidobacteraceae bacterium]|nr:TonB-dependent receptor [Steroidobacteraceae bacterium]
MGYRSVFTQQHFVATAVRLALASGVLSLALAAMPAAAQTATSDGATQTQSATSGATQAAPGDAATQSAASGTLLLAQTVQPSGGTEETNPANPTPLLQEVVVTGFRESLAKATAAKKDAIGFTDSIYSEDIGKFADNNIAESFNRIPGITIARDITGQGVNIAIRGLGPDFTKVLLNGAPIAVASTGPTDATNTNQEVDLNMFPTELFTSLTVEKTSSSDMLEGGAAGTVNMRTARPFDSPGAHLAFGAQGTKNQNAGAWGNHDYVVASDTFSNGFGVLLGGVVSHNDVATPGFETIGWTNPNLSVVGSKVSGAQAQCLASVCNGTGGGNWTIPATVPATAGNGLVPGSVINQAYLLAENPGASIQQIDNGIIPRLGRDSYEYGFEDTYNGVLSLEYRPNDALHFYVDNMFGKEHNDLQREDMDWVGRNGAAIPINETFDTGNCTNGCTVTGGTFANSQFFLEYRPYFEDTQLWGTNPGLNWRANDWLSGDVQANYTKSTFHREVPSVLVATAPDDTVTYSNKGGVPDISSGIDLDDPANFNWNGGRVNIQDERRETSTKGIRFNVTLGKGGLFNVKTGAAYDDIWRHIDAYDNSQAWQNAICGDNPNLFLTSPNSQPPCQGLSTGAPGAGYPTYPGLGTGYTAGMPASLAYQGSLIPQSALTNYLAPGPDGFITVNWPALAAASNYAGYHGSEPAAGSSNTGASGGYVRNSDTGLYVEFTGETAILGRGFRYNAGVRWVRTMQYIGGLVSLPDPRNAVLCGGTSGMSSPCDGAFYPNISNFATTENNYNNTLPSLELVYNIMPNFLARFAASKTMTRPNPNSMLPGLNFSTPSADVGTVGNSALQPYISKNLDFGLEYYTGKEGYVALALFRKKITGFTANGNTTVPFSGLAQYGVTYATLTPTQQAAIDARGGPDAATVVLQEQVNATGLLTVTGEEIDWTQPFDFLTRHIGIEGFGFEANYTHISQTGTGAAPAIATGVPPDTYNLTFYYEHGPWSFRMAENYNAANVVSGLNQNGIPLAALYASSYREWDLSSYVDIGTLLRWPMSFQITANALNLFDGKQRSYFQFTDATYTEYNPGRELMIGFRAKF